MKFRRITFLVATTALLAGGAFGATSALSSAKIKAAGYEGKAQPGDRSTATPRGTVKCKAQACVNFDDNASMFVGTIKKVVFVGHPSTGVYCVQLVGSLGVTSNTMALTTVDWPDSPDNFIVAAWNYHTADCATSGFPNAVRLDVMQDDAGTGYTFANEAVVFAVP